MSLNLYTYVANNPLTRTDPSGHCFWDACVGEAGAAIVYGIVAGLAAIGAGIGVGQATVIEQPILPNEPTVIQQPVQERQPTVIEQPIVGPPVPTVVQQPIIAPKPVVIQQPIVQQSPTILMTAPFEKIGITLNDYQTLANTLPGNPNQLLERGFSEIKEFAPHRRSFWSEEMRLKVSFDAGQAGANGWEGKDHYHIWNPFSENAKVDLYLDVEGNPVGKGSKKSHIAPQINIGN